jgi:hypothetical protein
MSATLDWTLLEKSINKKSSMYSFEENKQYFTKIAADVYKANNGSSQLWELRDAEDGKKYLYALYNEAEDITITSKSDWSAISDSSGKHVTLAYRKTPIYRFDVEKFNINPSESKTFAEYIKKSAEKKEWRAALLATMEPLQRESVLKLIGGM